MNRRSSTYTALVSLLVFLLIEGLSLLLVSRNGAIQRYKLMSGIRNIQTLIWNKGENARYFISLKETNRQLEEENIRLVKELEKYKSFAYKHTSDSVIQAYNPEFKYIPAIVIKNSTNRRHNYIILDKGEQDGVTQDMGIITPSGVVGYIHSVGKKHSLAVSFLDVDNTITAIIKKSGTFGTFSWNGRNIGEASLREIPIHSTFSIGDTITTSGYSAMYPKGIDLGVIKSSQSVGGTSFDLTVSLFEDFSNLHYVYIVDNPNNLEFKNFINKEENLQ
ncbi:MAG: rod shape-determining protein MreC [Bacteroidales bacterium]|nr:rod shape-determining protein MreC [Bacteroidales bacterium]